MKARQFKITRRHYDIILKQGFDNHPEECGGFFGGKEDTIQALLPVYNQHLEDKTKTFMVTKEDVERAHMFFEKHGLKYYGVYHTHPNAPADPSPQDLSHREQFLLIVGYHNFKQPDFAIWEVINGFPYRCPLEILDKNYQIKDLDAAGVKIHSNCVVSNWEELTSKLSSLVSNQKIEYPKYESHSPYSDFNTLA